MKYGLQSRENISERHASVPVRLAQFVVGVLLVVLFTFGVLLGVASYKRTRAESLLRSIAQLNLRTSTFADAQRLAHNYDGKPWNGPFRKASCSSHDCDFKFVFDNKLLRHIPGVCPVEFVAGVRVKDGHVVSREVDYALSTTLHYEFAYLLKDNFESRKVEDYEVEKLKLDGQGIPHVVEVSLGPLATSDQKERAYSVDLSCLARLRGCCNPTAIFRQESGGDTIRVGGSNLRRS